MFSPFKNACYFLLFLLINLNIQEATAQVAPFYNYSNRQYKNRIINSYFLNLGLSRANDICDRYTRRNLRNECRDVVSANYFLDINAVTLCQDIFFISTRTITCFENIENKYYLQSEIIDCGNSRNEYTIYDCLNYSGKIIQQDQLFEEYETRLAYNNAQEVCNSFTNSTTRNRCNNILDNSYFLDLNAVNICRTKFSLSPKILNCLDTIRDRIYSFNEIRECQGVTNREKPLLNCLQQKGELITE